MTDSVVQTQQARIAALERQLAEMQRDLDICRLANGYETEATEAAERQLEEAHARITELETEVESLSRAADERFQAQWREGVGNPFYEAAAAAAGQRLTALKHEARANLDRAEAAERRLAELSVPGVLPGGDANVAFCVLDYSRLTETGFTYFSTHYAPEAVQRQIAEPGDGRVCTKSGLADVAQWVKFSDIVEQLVLSQPVNDALGEMGVVAGQDKAPLVIAIRACLAEWRLRI